jgi:hypothetical protein
MMIDYFLPPTDFSPMLMFSSLPSIVLAFAYHQQFFTTSYRIKDAHFKMSVASLQGCSLHFHLVRVLDHPGFRTLDRLARRRGFLYLHHVNKHRHGNAYNERDLHR